MMDRIIELARDLLVPVGLRDPALPLNGGDRRRLERFSAIYQRICENLSRRSSMRRSSFSIVRGADPS